MPNAISPPLPGTPTSIDATNFAVFVSTLDTVPSPWFKVQIAPAPKVRKRGCGPTAMESVTLFVFTSTRVSRFFSGVVTQMAPSPYKQETEFGGTAISATTRFDLGSIRDNLPALSVNIQTASGLVVTPPSLSAGPSGIVASTAFVLMLTRESDLSPQFG